MAGSKAGFQVLLDPSALSLAQEIAQNLKWTVHVTPSISHSFLGTVAMVFVESWPTTNGTQVEDALKNGGVSVNSVACCGAERDEEE